MHIVAETRLSKDLFLPEGQGRSRTYTLNKEHITPELMSQSQPSRRNIKHETYDDANAQVLCNLSIWYLL